MSVITGITTVLDVHEYMDICLKYILYPYEDIVDMIVWSLTHLLKESKDLIEILLKSNFLPELFKIIKRETSLALARTYAWFFSVLFKNTNHSYPIALEIILEILQITSNLLDNKDEELLVHAVWTMANAADSIYEGLDKYIIKLRIHEKIMKIKPFNDIKIGILSFIGNICCGEDDIIDVY